MMTKLSEWAGIVREFGSAKSVIDDWDDGHYLAKHPNICQVEGKLTEALVFPTVVTTRGMTAIMATLMALREPNMTIIASKHIYPGTIIQFLQWEDQDIFNVEWFDPSDLTQPQQLLQQLEGTACLVYTEGVGNNPLMSVQNIQSIVSITHTHGAQLVIDTTFTPFFSRLDLGPYQEYSDHVVLVGSMTKYEGADDSCMGGRISANLQLLETITSTRFFENVVMDIRAAEYFLECRIGLDTMRARYDTHCQIALAMAELMENHPAMEQVWYPGLESHSQHQLMEQYPNQQAGGLFFAQLRGGRQAAEQLTDALKDLHGCWRIGVSMGSQFPRIFPIIIDAHVEYFGGMKGVVRIASGHYNRNISLGLLQRALDSLLD